LARGQVVVALCVDAAAVIHVGNQPMQALTTETYSHRSGC
jgi:hypothetical protein